MNKEEKKKIGEEFEKVLREIGITDIKDSPERKSIKTQHRTWLIK